LRAAPAIAALLVLSACPTYRGTDPDAGTAQFVGRVCNVDIECGSLRCDKQRHQCICLSDDSCKGDPSEPPKYCNNYTGLCVEEITGCHGDAECGSTQFCDPSIRACRPLKSFCGECSSDSECGGSQDNCLLDTELNTKFCGKACATNTDCPRGSSCQNQTDGTKQCWPSESPVPGQTPSCKNFKGCTPDSLRTCNADADCADVSQRCDPARGKCVATEQVCPFGTACDPSARICVAVCFVDADCGDPKLRCTDKLCEPINECTNDLECPANKVCNVPPGATKGECAPFCAADADCPLGQSCQKVSDRYKCQPGCSTQANCPLNQRCNLGTSQCEGPTVGSVRTCQATVACNSCELCDQTKYECVSAKTGAQGFPHCTPCTAPSECTGGTCVGLDDGNSYCLKFCGAGIECPQGFVCLGTGNGQNVCAPSNRQCAGKCP
jgi:hypothetical protein